MKINMDDLRKLESSSVPTRSPKAHDMVKAIVKVKQAGYVPDSVHVRASISPFILTCEFAAEQLPVLERDPKIESIALNQSLSSD